MSSLGRYFDATRSGGTGNTSRSFRLTLFKTVTYASMKTLVFYELQQKIIIFFASLSCCNCRGFIIFCGGMSVLDMFHNVPRKKLVELFR
jgi:hypothetical protein